MANANYTYRKDDKIIWINDLDIGNMTVTNDIERVVSEICAKESLSKLDYIWVYNDSDGVWCGWNPMYQTFYFLEGESRSEVFKNSIIQHRLIHLPYNEHE